MSRPALGLWLTTAIWIAAAAGLWAYFDRQLENGTEVALQAVPVDPRDVLRGDYVVLRYAVSTVERTDDRGDWWLTDGQVVFVTIARREGDWTIEAVDRSAPEEGLFLRGRMLSRGPDRFEIQYGIESYFVPEGEGREYEEARNRKRLWAVISVSPHGMARLKRLEIR